MFTPALPIILKLDPRYPVVWRSPTAVQVGVDRATVLLEHVTTAEERMLHALGPGVGLDGLRMIGERARASPRAVARFLERVSPALLASPGPVSRPLTGQRVRVIGSLSACRPLRQLLAHRGAELSDDAGGAGDSGDAGESGDAGDAAPIDLAVLVAAWAVHPAESGRWLRADIAHLPVVFGDREIRIGPLVVPGAGPCLHCCERAAIDDDPAWPAIAAQLMRRTSPLDEPFAIASMLAPAVRACIEAMAGSALEGRVRHVHPDIGQVSESWRFVHPECGCRALPETGRAPEPASGSPPSRPTTAPGAGAPE